MNQAVVSAPAPLPPALAQLRRTLVMGIVNVTPDSFSDGGCWFSVDRALAHAHDLVAQGADLVDVGGQSTRPGAPDLTAAAELERILPVVRALAADGVPVSVDTIHAETAAAVVDAGAVIVNDVSGGSADPKMYSLIADLGVVYVCQHWRGNPQTMDKLTDYGGDVVGGVVAQLRQRLDALAAAGVKGQQIVVDPGLGFAKTNAQSWQLLAASAHIRTVLGHPLLIGASRKRFLAAALAAEPGRDPLARDAATAATSALAALAGAWAVRVHEIPANRDAVAVAALWKEAQ